MHKKSIEASKKMSEEDNELSDSEAGSEGKGRVKEEMKSESIATLRAKAQEHSAKVLQALHTESDGSYYEMTKSPDQKRPGLGGSLHRGIDMC